MSECSASNTTLQRARRPRSGSSLRSLGAPLNAQPLGLASWRVITVVAMICLSDSAVHGSGSLTGAAPRGFVWQSLKPLRAKVLRVIGWNHGLDETEAGWTYSNSENDDRGVPSAQFLLAADLRPKGTKNAEAVLADVWRDLERRVEPEGSTTLRSDRGFLVQRAVFIRHLEQEPESTHRLLVEVRVSRKTLASYLIIFEAPTSRWGSGWKRGEAIVNSLVLNDGV
jgi:hypothetical protein